MLELEDKSFCIFGLPDSGKSTLASFILAQFGASAFVYDTLSEYPGTPYDSYSPHDRTSKEELGRIIRPVFTRGKYRLLMIDEANRFCPTKPAPLPQAIADLNDWRAHYSVSVGFIARRPVQLNQDLTELAHYLFIFGLRGKNDVQYLNDISAGLGDAVTKIPPYHFILVSPDRSYTLYAPVPRGFATNKKIQTPGK